MLLEWRSARRPSHALSTNSTNYNLCKVPTSLVAYLVRLCTSPPPRRRDIRRACTQNWSSGPCDSLRNFRETLWLAAAAGLAVSLRRVRGRLSPRGHFDFDSKGCTERANLNSGSKRPAAAANHKVSRKFRRLPLRIRFGGKWTGRTHKSYDASIIMVYWSINMLCPGRCSYLLGWMKVLSAGGQMYW